jgi:hypothetical protein
MGFGDVTFPETTAAGDVDVDALVAAGRVRARRRPRAGGVQRAC